jgi:uncharacterized membrane protein
MLARAFRLTGLKRGGEAMKGLLEFLKTTALGGLFVLLPLLLLYLALGEALGLVVAIATPIADLFPADTFAHEKYPVLIAVLLLLGVSFALGLAMRAERGRSLGQWLERTTLRRLPMYGALKTLIARFAESEKCGAFRPALLISGEGQRDVAYVIEDHGDGQMTVMLPWAPTPLAGSVRIVDRDHVELLDASFADLTRVLSEWGIGTREMLGKGASDAGAAPDKDNVDDPGRAGSPTARRDPA